MSPSSRSPPNPKKSRGRMPNFGHLDPHQAKKRKKQWLTTQKIKASYRAEKRRMGLTKVPASPGTGEAHDRAEDEVAKTDSSDEEYPDRPSPEAGASPEPPITATRRTREARPGAVSKKDGKDTASAQPTPSLRELARDAYSPASLHTHKSNPLRRQPQGKNNSRPQANGPSNRAGNGGRGAPDRGPARGRGQPNMAKRMGVLLEKIKRAHE